MHTCRFDAHGSHGYFTWVSPWTNSPHYCTLAPILTDCLRGVGEVFAGIHLFVWSLNYRGTVRSYWLFFFCWVEFIYKYVYIFCIYRYFSHKYGYDIYTWKYTWISYIFICVHIHIDVDVCVLCPYPFTYMIYYTVPSKKVRGRAKHLWVFWELFWIPESNWVCHVTTHRKSRLKDEVENSTPGVFWKMWTLFI